MGRHFDPVLREAGVRSWSSFVNGTTSVSVTLDDHDLTIIPLRNRGSEGFAEMTKLKRSLPGDASAFELGSAVVAALADSE